VSDAAVAGGSGRHRDRLPGSAQELRLQTLPEDDARAAMAELAAAYEPADL
jgi:hypothetical protein